MEVYTLFSRWYDTLTNKLKTESGRGKCLYPLASFWSHHLCFLITVHWVGSFFLLNLSADTYNEQSMVKCRQLCYELEAYEYLWQLRLTSIAILISLAFCNMRHLCCVLFIESVYIARYRKVWSFLYHIRIKYGNKQIIYGYGYLLIF